MNGVSSHSFSKALIVVSPLYYVVLIGTGFYLPNSSANLVVGYFWLPWTNVLLVEQTELIDDPTHQGSARRIFLIDDPNSDPTKNPTSRTQRGGHLTPGLGSPLRRSPTRQVRTSPRTINHSPTDILGKFLAKIEYFCVTRAWLLLRIPRSRHCSCPIVWWCPNILHIQQSGSVCVPWLHAFKLLSILNDAPCVAQMFARKWKRFHRDCKRGSEAFFGF